MLNSVLFDGVQVSDDFEDVGDNRFVYWPHSLNRGQHTVEVEASDSARNDFEFDFSFESVGRGDFVLDLQTGWNAVSVPSKPIDPSIGAVFTDPAITTVIAWIDGRWHLAVRRGDTWEAKPELRSPIKRVKRIRLWGQIRSLCATDDRIARPDQQGEKVKRLFVISLPQNRGGISSVSLIRPGNRPKTILARCCSTDKEGRCALAST